MEIKEKYYYILKQSEDLGDVIQVIAVYPGQIVFKYYMTDQSVDKRLFPKRALYPEAFKACYKPHNTLNILYND